MDDCLFCKIVDKKIPARTVHEDEAVFAFEDINPQAPVHILIVPKQHIASVNDASESQVEMLGGLILAARRLAKARKVESTGYRLVLNTMAGAGQSVFHLHLHLLGGRSFGWPPG